MRKITTFILSLYALAASSILQATPVITGSPKLISPNILLWPRDVAGGAPNLTERTSNTVLDMHARFNDCDMALSTSGNYHMALRDLWYDFYLPAMATAGYPLRTWLYTTSPPISPLQITNKRVTIGNVRARCLPQVVVGPGSIMDEVIALGVADGEPVPVIRNRGNVLLVSAGNPKNIQSIWDLKRIDVRVATSNPYNEPGSFGNYSSSIYNIALNDTPVGSTEADELYNAIFNSTMDDKWASGRRIHHREVPWLIARDHADVAPIFYHLALYAKLTFPRQFDIVPLGGTVDMPDPLPGNKVGTLFALKIKGDWSAKQLAARDMLVHYFQTQEFGLILNKYGIDVPIP